MSSHKLWIETTDGDKIELTVTKNRVSLKCPECGSRTKMISSDAASFKMTCVDCGRVFFVMRDALEKAGVPLESTHIG